MTIRHKSILDENFDNTHTKAKIYDNLGNDKPGIYYYRGKDKLLLGK